MQDTVLSKVFGVDLRSLAIFRIALAAVVLWDLADRARNLAAHYTDLGIVPGDLALALSGAGVRLSIHYWASPSPTAVALLFLVSAVAALALLVGYRTRLATIVTWYLVVSIQARNPWAATMGGDKLLRLMLFWGMLLPLGARYALDLARRPELRRSANHFVSMASAALLLQLALMYWATALQKLDPAWLRGEALDLALNLDVFVTRFGVWLRQFGGLLPILTYATLATELFGPCLAFSPWRTGWLRLGTIALFVLFHLGLAASLSIGYFQTVSLVGWCAFLPAELWQQVLPRITGRAAPVTDAAAEPLRTWRTTQWAAGICLAYVVVFVAAQIPAFGLPAFPRPLTYFGRVLRINQYWTMFAPAPPRVDGWPDVRGVLASGSETDLLRGGPPEETGHLLLADVMGSFRWRLYYTNVLDIRVPLDAREERVLGLLVDHYCRSHETDPGDPLQRVTISRVIQPTGRPIAPIEEVLIERPCASSRHGLDRS